MIKFSKNYGRLENIFENRPIGKEIRLFRCLSRFLENINRAKILITLELFLKVLVMFFLFKMCF